VPCFRFAFVLTAGLLVAGCATRHIQTGDGTATMGREPTLTSAGALPLAERLTFYTVPFR